MLTVPAHSVTVASSIHVPVLVLGAGLTGMSAAIALDALQVEHLVIEKAHQVGGLATTRLVSGFRFDRTGHLLHMGDARLVDRVLGWLDEEPLHIARQSMIYSSGVYTAYPYQANVHGLPPQVAYECLLGFIRAQLAKPMAPPVHFEAFCRQHFGDGIAEHFMLPYNERLLGVSLREITTTWCNRFVPQPTVEEVVAGAVGLPPKPLGYNATFHYPRLGIGELASAMGRRLRALRLGDCPLAIDAKKKLLTLTHGQVSYDVLVSTIPLPQLLALLGQPGDAVAAAARSLRSSHLYYFDVGLATRPGKELHWVYVPESRFPFYRVGSYSAFSSAMAPDGQGSLYVELAERDPKRARASWQAVVAGLVELGLIAGPDAVVTHSLERIDYAYVLYDRARDSALATLVPFLSSLDILTAGRYGGWEYSSMEDALRTGEAVAQLARERCS